MTCAPTTNWQTTPVVSIVDVVVRAAVLERDLLARLVLREVDDDLVALGHPDLDVGAGLRRRHQAAVGADHDERLAGVEREVVRARDRRVEDAEAVLARLDLHPRPRHPVDQDDVAVDPVLVVVVDDEIAAVLEHRVLEDQRHVVLTVRDRQGALGVGVHDVLRGEAHVGVVRRDVDAVVVVPERAGVLDVRVLVVLERARRRDVARVAVVLRQRARPVKVRRGPDVVTELRMTVGQRADLAHDGLAVLVDVDRRPRRHPVVAPDRRLAVRQDLRLHLLLGDREVVRIAHGHLRRRQRRLPAHGERRRQLALRQTIRDRELRASDALGRQHQCCAAEQTHLQQVTTTEIHDSLQVFSAGRGGRGVGVQVSDRGLTAKRARRNFAVRGFTVGVARITQIPHAVRAVMDVLRMTLPAASGSGIGSAPPRSEVPAAFSFTACIGRRAARPHRTFGPATTLTMQRFRAFVVPAPAASRNRVLTPGYGRRPVSRSAPERDRARDEDVEHAPARAGLEHRQQHADEDDLGGGRPRGR